MYKACKTGFTRQPVPSSLTLQDGSTTTSVKETANALFHKFFPDDSTDSDNGKQRIIRAQILDLKTVSDFVRNSRKRGLKCCLLALDLAGAFDNAWHPGILARLRKLKCPPNTYNMVKDFLCDRTAHVMLGNSLSSKRVTKGCPQGSVSGLTLWNIIINA